MTTRLITPPAALAVSLVDARAQLREPDVSLNSVIEAWIRGITAFAEHETGRAFINQTRRVTLDAFPDAIRLDYPPIASVTSVKYYDADGVQQTLDPADYVVDMASEPGYVVPAQGKAWPATQNKINAVEVDYVSGYGADDSAVPDGIKLFIKAKLVEQFSIEPGKAVQKSFIDSLLNRFKVYA